MRTLSTLLLFFFPFTIAILLSVCPPLPSLSLMCSTNDGRRGTLSEWWNEEVRNCDLLDERMSTLSRESPVDDRKNIFVLFACETNEGRV